VTRIDGGAQLPDAHPPSEVAAFPAAVVSLIVATVFVVGELDGTIVPAMMLFVGSFLPLMIPKTFLMKLTTRPTNQKAAKMHGTQRTMLKRCESLDMG